MVMTLHVCMHGHTCRKQRSFAVGQETVSAYNPITLSQERRYAITSEDDRFESSTIRRMSMRSSVFENRKLFQLALTSITNILASAVLYP